MSDLDQTPLGKSTAYCSSYTPELLAPVARATLRAELGIEHDLPFHGVDIWNAYEVSWLNGKGVPRVALGRFVFPAASPKIIESKSFKLYLNSFNQSRFVDAAEVQALLSRDLEAACGEAVDVGLRLPPEFVLERLRPLEGESIDGFDIDISEYSPRPDLLACDADIVSERLLSDLLKSNCPITGQPDWASVTIEYVGPRISRESLLRYLISFREHGGFHEHCVEQIFVDLLRTCRPSELTVHARYTRRGGLDINPFRSNVPGKRPDWRRTVRQ